MTSSFPDTQPEPRPPARALRLTLLLDADTRETLLDAIYDLADRIAANDITTAVWGGVHSGGICELLTNPDMTHDAYHASLRAYLEEKSGQKT